MPPSMRSCAWSCVVMRRGGYGPSNAASNVHVVAPTAHVPEMSVARVTPLHVPPPIAIESTSPDVAALHASLPHVSVPLHGVLASPVIVHVVAPHVPVTLHVPRESGTHVGEKPMSTLPS